MSIDEADQKQNEFNTALVVLTAYARSQKYIEAKNKNWGKAKITEGFKNRIFPTYNDDKWSRFKDDDKDDMTDRNGFIDCEKLDRLIFLKKKKDINNELVKKHFLV